jgi:DNA (cytosine-5)-methyltransferase 1
VNELTHLDLFSGIGGFALAAKWAGFRTIGFSEVEPYACRLLAERFPAVPNFGDVRKFGPGKVGPVTVLTGGFPCQPWSVAGDQRGEDDVRHLWPATCDVIKEVRPTWFIGENVLGLEIMGGLDRVLDDLESINYETQPFIVPACAVGRRQRRDRIWILGHDSNAHGDGPQGRVHEPEEICGPWSQVEFERLVQVSLQRGVPSRRSGGISDGIPHRSQRLKGLGNAIVPQVAERFLRFIAAIESGQLNAT